MDFDGSLGAITRGRGNAIYGKIFKSIYYGSLSRDHDARDLFICLCAHADQEGFVDMNLDSVGRVLSWDIDRLSLAAKVLLGPDQDSGTPELEGRRITANGLVSRGIKIVNYLTYRAIQTEEDRRAYQSRYYKKTTKPKRHNDSTSVNIPKLSSTDPIQGEGDGEVEGDKYNNLRSSSDDQAGRSSENGPEEITAMEAFEEIFWPEYPRKVAKARARKSWKALKLKDSDEETLDRIMGKLALCIREEWMNRDLDKVPHPSTWLNDRRWED